MLIYKVPNFAPNFIHYFCDSQATIDAIPLVPSPVNPNKEIPAIDSSLCSVGTQADADALLITNQQTWLAQQAGLFTVNLQTTVEGGVVWTVVNLATEPANTDREYFVLDPTTGSYTEVVGLDAAKVLFLQTQQTYLVFTKMNSYTTMTSRT